MSIWGNKLAGKQPATICQFGVNKPAGKQPATTEITHWVHSTDIILQ